MYSQVYEGEYYPSAPVATITVRKPDSKGNEITLTALVDSGADATMIPLSALKAIRARPLGKDKCAGFWGKLVK